MQFGPIIIIFLMTKKEFFDNLYNIEDLPIDFYLLTDVSSMFNTRDITRRFGLIKNGMVPKLLTLRTRSRHIAAKRCERLRMQGDAQEAGEIPAT